MHNEMALSVPLRDALIAFEREVGRPLYVRNCRGVAVVPGRPITAYQPLPIGHVVHDGVAGYTPADLPEFTEENTLILHSYGVFGDNVRRAEIYNLPRAFYADNADRNTRVHSIAIASSPSQMVLDDDTFVDPRYHLLWAQALPNEVAFTHPIEFIRDPRSVNWEDILVRFLRRAADPAFMEGHAERLAQQTEEAFAAIMNEVHEVQVREREAAFQQAERMNQTLVAELGQNVAQLQAARHALDAIQAVEGISPERIAQEWENLNNHARITNVRGSGDMKLEITTDTIVMTHPNSGVRRTIGEFLITADFRRNTVNLTNLRGARGDRFHPHVPRNGQPCWGEIGPLVVELVAHREIVALVEVVIQYLESFNPRDSWGVYAELWFNRADENPEFNTTEGLQPYTPPAELPTFDPAAYYDEDTDRYTLPSGREYTWHEWHDRFTGAQRQRVIQREQEFIAQQDQQTVNA